MVVHKVLKSKVEIYLAFLLTSILFSLVTMEKKFAQPRISYNQNKSSFCCENILQYWKSFSKMLGIASESGFVLQVFDTNKSGIKVCLTHFR